MKICFLAGADSIHSKIWIEYLADKGYEIYWISLTPDNFGSPENVKFYLLRNFKLKPFSILFNALIVRKLVKRIKPDIKKARKILGYSPLLLNEGLSEYILEIKSCCVK